MILIISPTIAFDTAKITVGTATFQVEIARSPEQRERGLMFRPQMALDQGMLFLQPTGPAAFWMKNTYIPLDLLYFDSEGRLLQIQSNILPCTTAQCPIYTSTAANIRYILEINAGEAARQEIRPGDRLRLTD